MANYSGVPLVHFTWLLENDRVLTIEINDVTRRASRLHYAVLQQQRTIAEPVH